MADVLPPCGIYRTTATLEGVPSGRLVYFHNHGEPGPGIYLPESWTLNRAQFSRQGTTLRAEQARLLTPLPEEGLYRVMSRFTCCIEAHRSYAPDTLVQLGYDGRATPILFLPEWAASGLSFPLVGQAIDEDRLSKLAPLVLTASTAAHQLN